jgi:hypothetical protein
MADRMTLVSAAFILRRELEGYIRIDQDTNVLIIRAIRQRDMGHVERQIDHWLGAYHRLNEIRIANYQDRIAIYPG